MPTDTKQRPAAGGGAASETPPTPPPLANEQQQQQQPASSENIKVAVRLRPFTERERQRNRRRIVDIEQSTVALYNPRAHGADLLKPKKFTFDHSYWSHDGFRRNAEGVNVPDEAHPHGAKYVGQAQVFEELGNFLLDNAIQGYNSALLAYGQTGSGKSYTVSGYGHNEGILPRFARALFSELDRRAGYCASGGPVGPPGASNKPAAAAAATDDGGPKAAAAAAAGAGNRYEVHFSMIEIYNEVVRDLLTQSHGQAASLAAAARRGLKVREHPKRGFFVEGLSSYACANKDEIERRIEEGQLNKSIAATSMNETSSRGHTIYEFRIKQYKRRDLGGAGGAGGDATAAAPTSGQLNKQQQQQQQRRQQLEETLTTSVVQLVDLAGSERMAVHVTGQLGGDSFIGSRSSSPYQMARQQQQQQQPANIVESELDGASPAGPPGAATTTTTTSTTMARSKSQRSTAAGARMAAPTSASSSASSSMPHAHPHHPHHHATSSSMRIPARAGPQAGDHHQQRFKESVSINQSLSALGNCIQVLSQYSQQQQQQQQQQLHHQPAQAQQVGAAAAATGPKIPYRDSVLTKLLNRCCLSGNSKVVIIATLSPADANYDDTLSTLRFADRAKQIRTHATVNRMSRGEMVSALQRENERLKQLLVDGRVTRSDDSSQTSNFDDTENMLDNFNGPRVPPSAGAASTSSSAAAAAARDKSQAVQGAPRARNHGATVRRGPVPPKRAGGSVQRRGQQQAGEPRGTRPAAGAAGAAAVRHKSETRTMRQQQQRHLGGGSDPALAAGPDEQTAAMSRLISPAARKLAAAAAATSNDHHHHQQAGRASIKKSRSMGTGLNREPGALAAADSNEEDGAGAEADEMDELDLEASSLLDELDLNELADIEEGLLSPDSDDSFAALADDGLSNEEKIGLLNRLLSHSNVANKIRRQYEQQQLTGGGKLARPTRGHSRPTGGGAAATGSTQHQQQQQQQEGLSRVTAISSTLKRTNPYLSNLNPDEQLTGMISYIIKQGEMIVGKSNDCDILLYGPELRGRHARITRLEDESKLFSRVYIEPIEQTTADDKMTQQPHGQNGDRSTPAPADVADKRVALMVNGRPVTGRTQLRHCDRLLFGSNAYFVFIDQQRHRHEQAAAGQSDTVANEDLVTYDMAHGEVLRKVMSEANNEAVIKEINHYTHRPGTGKQKPAEPKAAQPQAATGDPKLSHVKSSKLTRSMTIQDQDQDQDQGGGADGLASALTKTSPTDVIEEGPEAAKTTDEVDDEQQQREDYRERLMEDTYEYAMPVAEVNAVAKEMQIKVSYGLKILTGEEQLPEQQQLQLQLQLADSTNGSDTMSSVSGSQAGAAAATGDQPPARVQSGSSSTAATPTMNPFASSSSTSEHQSTSPAVVTSSIKPESLDVPPALFIHVHLDELDLDFYWSKEKFQARIFKMMELYGAWDVGGKSGLVEHLIEQSKYDGNYMLDPFIDDPASTQVLVGHAQVTLRPISHRSDLEESYDILDINDELVGSLRIQARPCHQLVVVDDSDDPARVPTSQRPAADAAVQPVDSRAQSSEADAETPPGFRALDEHELADGFVEDPRQLLGQRLAFMIRILACENVPQKYHRLYCQYTLNRESSLVRTRLARDSAAEEACRDDLEEAERQQQQQDNPGEGATGASREQPPGPAVVVDEFNHTHYVVIHKVDQDILDFLEHGFLAVQVVGQYRVPPPAQPDSGGASSQRSAGSPTLITTIINSIQKYKFRVEQQLLHHHHQHHRQSFGGNEPMNYQNSVYTNSVTDSAKSHHHHHHHHHHRMAGVGGGSSGIMNTSNSGASSVASASASTSATVNLFDRQNAGLDVDDDDEAINSSSMNGLSQENIIDMILTKRKLDRAENQLHYLKRTINIAEHYNKKHIPVKTVKKLLNSYGHEIESGSLEEMVADVNVKGAGGGAGGKGSSGGGGGKHSNCSIQ